MNGTRAAGSSQGSTRKDFVENEVLTSGQARQRQMTRDELLAYLRDPQVARELDRHYR